jgi:hypothetical protein
MRLRSASCDSITARKQIFLVRNLGLLKLLALPQQPVLVADRK